MEDDIKKACEIMEKGGIILYPTDTIWGIGCDATNEDAYRKPCIECPQRTEYHKNQGGRHFPGGSKGCICHKRSIGISFWLD